MDWFNPKNHGTLSLQDVEKEIQMEAIDVLHFVMNIGLELWVEDSKLEEWANSIPEDILPPMPDKCNMACAYLITKCITLIDCMPWKSWKGYDLLTIEDYRSLLLEDYGNAYKMALVLAGHTGLSKQAIVNLYFAKNKENHDRQTRGY
jgi:dimeric dUTPase (all-alpha-NTP-PPase superfamily)